MKYCGTCKTCGILITLEIDGGWKPSLGALKNLECSKCSAGESDGKTYSYDGTDLSILSKKEYPSNHDAEVIRMIPNRGEE